MAGLGLLSQPQGAGLAETKLGGIRIFARSPRELEQGLRQLSVLINDNLAAHASLDRRALLRRVADAAGEWLDQRVFSAVLGSQLRVGRADSILCAAESGRVFRVLVARENLAAFHGRVRQLGQALKNAQRLWVRDVRDLFFPAGGPGAWTYARHICARAVFVGTARYADRFSLAWPEGLDRAAL